MWLWFFVVGGVLLWTAAIWGVVSEERARRRQLVWELAMARERVARIYGRDLHAPLEGEEIPNERDTTIVSI